MKKKLLAPCLVMAMISGLYAACYIQGSCQCIAVGQCYGSQTPNGCQTPTCIIADVSASAWNTCPGPGPFTGRQMTQSTTCFISACRIYNNCTQQYEPPPFGCNYAIPYYSGVGSNCQ